MATAPARPLTQADRAEAARLQYLLTPRMKGWLHGHAHLVSGTTVLGVVAGSLLGPQIAELTDDRTYVIAFGVIALALAAACQVAAHSIEVVVGVIMDGQANADDEPDTSLASLTAQLQRLEAKVDALSASARIPSSHDDGARGA